MCNAPVISRGQASVSHRDLGWVLREQPGPTGEPRGDPMEEMLMGEYLRAECQPRGDPTEEIGEVCKA